MRLVHDEFCKELDASDVQQVLGGPLDLPRLLSAGGQPLVLMDSQAVCVPNGTPLMPVAAQPRVIGS